jgi:quinol-cytochrome oxidoreductase complex cytochrome b subunit
MVLVQWLATHSLQVNLLWLTFVVLGLFAIGLLGAMLTSRQSPADRHFWLGWFFAAMTFPAIMGVWIAQQPFAIVELFQRFHIGYFSSVEAARAKKVQTMMARTVKTAKGL